MELSALCPHCRNTQELTLTTPTSATCKECKLPLFPQATEAFLKDFTLNQCPFCGAAHLYRQKDFNRVLGVAILLVGIGFAYFTYGISLLIVTLIDFLLYRYVGIVGCCYRCQAQFRASNKVDALEVFDLEIYDYYKSLKT